MLPVHEQARVRSPVTDIGTPLPLLHSERKAGSSQLAKVRGSKKGGSCCCGAACCDSHAVADLNPMPALTHLAVSRFMSGSGDEGGVIAAERDRRLP